MKSYLILKKLLEKQMASKIFKSKMNPVTGTAEWVVETEDYDFYQEIARSGYADMLHDHERNILYYRALKNVIGQLKKSKKIVNAVDIGTGTGLLAMMAVKAGADHVYAIETFEPIAITAKKIIALNGFSDKIDVISKRSTDISDEEMPNRANVAVAEVFDTELIGEGALKTFLEAHKTLLTNPGRVIPARGTIFVQIIQSDLVLRWQKAFPVELPEHCVKIQVPAEILQCSGSPAVHDLQVNRIPRELFSTLTDPTSIFTFNFENPAEIRFDESRTVEFLTKTTNFDEFYRPDAAVMWWDLDMDGTGNVILSTKPQWPAEDGKNDSHWRDHWMQALYYFPDEIRVKNGQKFEFRANHDEYSMWFSNSNSRPVCDCGLHLVFSRPNLARFNDLRRYSNFAAFLSSDISGKSCLSVGDCSLLPLIAVQMGAERVYAVETNRTALEIIESYALFNEIDVGNRLIFVENAENLPINVTFDLVFCDFFFFNSFLPWHNLYIWYFLDELREKNSKILANSCRIFPDKAVLLCLPLNFDDLHKIRKPVKNVQGFDLTPFDDIVQAAIKTCDGEVEPHHLWEYPSTALSDAQVLLEFDLTRPHLECASTNVKNIPLLDTQKECNGVALWIDWFYENKLISSGLKRECAAGERPDWDWNQRQGVHFTKNYSNMAANFLKIETKFVPHLGDVQFLFGLHGK